MNATEINKFPIREYLASIGIRPAKDRGYYGMYKSLFRDERTPSMKVDFEKNLWIDYGSRDGGTLIDLVMRLERCDAGQAMRRLEQRISGSSSLSFHGNTPDRQLHTPAIKIEKVQPLQNPALSAYLKERGINVDIAKLHCPEVHYSVAGKPYYAIGFRNDKRCYELRSKYFKGCTSKAPTTVLMNSRDCTVFEGFMNYLSYLTLTGESIPKTDTVILNSVTNLSKAMQFIASHDRVITYLDNDETGRKATAELRTVCKNLSDQSTRYSRHNDLNAYLQNHPVKKEPARPVNRHCGARAEQAGLTSPSREEEKPAGLKGNKCGRSM